MAISVDYQTLVITVEQSDCTLVSGTFYTLDTETQLRLLLMAMFADENHIWMKIPYQHNTQYTIAGTTYARSIAIINGYSIKFMPDTQWSVQLESSNNDVWDIGGGILVQNQVQVIPGNAAGLIVVTSGSGLSTEQDTKLSEVHKYSGLDAADPIEHTPTQSVTDSADIDITRSGDGETLSRLERQ